MNLCICTARCFSHPVSIEMLVSATNKRQFSASRERRRKLVLLFASSDQLFAVVDKGHFIDSRPFKGGEVSMVTVFQRALLLQILEWYA